MDKKTAKQKSFQLMPIDNIETELELINQHTIKPLTAEEVYIFKIILCDNDVDRIGDKMTEKFLSEFEEASKGLTGLKDHDWESDNQLSRLYDTEVVVDESVMTVLGEPRKYVLGKAYTLTKYKDYVDKINAGLLKEVSISFESSEDVCSICGEVTKKKSNEPSICPNGHIMGNEYDGKLCYNIINNLLDSYEWSLVAVPCQRNSGIKNKNFEDGGINIMKKSMFMLQKILNSKAFKEADEETKKELEGAVVDEADQDLSEEDIKELIAENARLKEEVSVLKSKVKEVEGGRTMDKVEAIVSKAIDDMNPLTPTVKENILRDIDLNGFKLVDGEVEGLDESLSTIKEKYKGLISSGEEDKEPEVKEEVKEEVEEEVEEEEEDTKVKSKSFKHNSGISFGVNATVKSKPSTKAGRQIN